MLHLLRMREVMMRNTFIVGVLCVIALLLTISSALAAGTLSVRISQATINGITVEPYWNNSNETVILEAGSNAEIDFEFWSTSDLRGVEIEAFLAGHSATPVERRTATLTMDEMKTSTIYSEHLAVKVPEDISPGDYTFMLIFSDDEASLVREYGVEVTQPDHGIMVRGISITPEGTLKAGRTVGVQVEVYNFGRYHETVTISTSIPDLELGQQKASFTIAPRTAKYSDTLYFTLPVCTPAGSYSLKGIVEYANGLKRDVFVHSFDVMENPDCGIIEPEVEGSEIIVGHNGEKTIITVPPPQSAYQNGGEAVYNIGIANAGKWRRSYYLEIKGIEWVWSSLSPSNLVVLEPGSSVTFSLGLRPKDTADLGVHVFTADIKSGDMLLQQITLAANVLADPDQDIAIDPKLGDVTANVVKRGPGKGVDAAQLAEIGITLLVTAAVIVIALFYFSRLNGSKQEREEFRDRRYYRKIFRGEPR